MYRRFDPSPELRRLIEHQSGVVTREQATAFGLGPRSQQRLVEQEHWQRLGPGLLLSRAGPVEWLSLAWAGALWGGDDARLGGLAAAYLHKLTDQPPKTILVLTPHRIQRESVSPWLFRRERAGVRSRSVGALPRTSIDDTVLDLCEQSVRDLGDGIDGRGRKIDGWISDAVQRKLTTPKRLKRALSARSRFAGRRLVEKIISEVAGGAQSVLELAYLRNVERAHGLPRGRRQVGARLAGGRIYRDVRYEKYHLLVELDGETGHIGEDRFRDFRRDNAALLEGEVTLRYGRVDVDTEPCAIAWQVAEMLVRGGWAGMVTPCPNCSRP
ncbi:type IV toxin-antitoxin system AbiEi family antitoxin domain-containing protein [Microlunatus elymi]|uniref:Type IV toxin-antitoxin system AbiEi family antitoxin domain-containing protein n=1 Tax=Microlunatus elymi TaxID=2596828 RepID=A0A516PVT9_9ACTN|nr:type IV toxin-antitoxin system AbiEi family antitoxin domain-containing protein [Microlunatus elymi]QDP95071.1 type IV toxin-antitoxin system AbiEi family antitoxin domain-containing protein [Microlunatus elymi]